MEGNRAVVPRNFQSHIKFLVTTTSYNHFLPPQKKISAGCDPANYRGRDRHFTRCLAAETMLQRAISRRRSLQFKIKNKIVNDAGATRSSLHTVRGYDVILRRRTTVSISRGVCLIFCSKLHTTTV